MDVEELVKIQKKAPMDLKHHVTYWSSAHGKKRCQRRRKLFLKDLGKQDRLLEIGCGIGIFSSAFSKPHFHVGGDLDYQVLNWGKKEGTLHGRQAQMDAHQLPFASQSFDGAFGNAILHHLNPHLALQELRRVLKPGSPLLFSEPNLNNPLVWAIKKIPLVGKLFHETEGETAWRPHQYRQFFSEAGFQNVEVTCYDFCFGPALFLGAIEKIEPFLENSPLAGISGSVLIRAKA